MWIFPFLVFGIFFAVFLIIAISIFKSHKHSGDTMQNMINTISAYAEKEIEHHVKQLDADNTEKTCEYCGSKISNGSNKCDACGAKVKNK
ncbi:MAG: hypothetical protein ACLRFE_01670 [Clostridia bacterium]